jgi:membrane-associated protease RseP (regulator of RpoE activity)
MSWNKLKNATAWSLAIAVALSAGAFALAQDQQAKGRIVQIGPDDQGQKTPALPAPDDKAMRSQLPAVSPYWIGLLGGPVTPELRAHVDLPEDQGLLVREIVPNSPAAKSGLKLYDILLRANDTQLHEMRDLVELVRTEGQKQGQITLEVLRKGQRQSVAIKPEERPANIAQTPGAFGQGDVFQGQPGQIPMLGQMPELRRFFEGFGGEGAPLEFRQFGPGVIVGGNDAGLANMPNGLSISIQKQNDQPARATVKRGNESWEVVQGDAESLQQLPADVRPFVEQMLGGSGNRFDFDRDGDVDLPVFREPALRQRLEAVERQLQQLLEKQSREGSTPNGGQQK